VGPHLILKDLYFQCAMHKLLRCFRYMDIGLHSYLNTLNATIGRIKIVTLEQIRHNVGVHMASLHFYFT